MSSQNAVKPTEGSNPELASRAQKALFIGSYETEPGMCQRFVRQVIQAEYGDDFNNYHQASADDSMEKWKWSKYAVDPRNGSLVGDILYKAGTRRQPAGHVGIRIPGNRVAENSRVHRNGANGGKGVRTLEAFGKVDLIVRLPRPK